ncbi:unnamed protein product [Paramecium sonneborni]|uniref:Galactokinase n=1 Tax=Paramecium sonneborni TaxID=65129 RepID=A0A8S1MT92_9CILI|nr:unnamed protein product [Paramecium sonneborni]
MNIQQLIELFTQRYNGLQPQFLVKAPGRVNLIGEHIDYMGYGVLPFALEQSCFMLFATDGNDIQIQHADDQQFKQTSLSVNPKEEYKEIQNYVKYVLAGYKAGIQYGNANQGIKILISGNLPFSSGLSSSSSLVVASSLMSLQVSGKTQQDIDRHQFVNQIIKFEREAGTACGGMDQTISVFGQEGSALYIEFDPLKLTQVNLPKGYSFIIANSLTESTKLETLGKHYNKRVVECRIGIKLIELALNLGTNYRTLKQLQDHLQLSLESMEELCRFIPKGDLDFEQLQYLNLPVLLSDIPYFELVLNQNQNVNPYNRLIHVVKEAQRVIKFKNICDSKMSDDIKAILLGQLMNQSQKSCKELYECSSDNIDKLTTLCIKNGALGSRLTGAGWGGCTVSLVKEQEAKNFKNKIIEFFYNHIENQDHIFSTQPSQGASIIKL